jgi:hypothetical protein
VRGVSVPCWMVLTSLKNLARFSSNLVLPVILLKQWFNFFCQSVVCRPLAAHSVANSLFGKLNPACVRFVVCYWGLQRMCCCLWFRMLHWSVTSSSMSTDSVAGSVSGVSNSLILFVVNAGLVHASRDDLHLFTSCRHVVSGRGSGWFFCPYWSCQPASAYEYCVGILR